MSEKLVREFSLPLALQERIEFVLKKNLGVSLSDSRVLAESVQKMSDFYIAHPQAATPWSERWCRIAQLAYYLPLNYLRAQAVLVESRRFDFFAPIDTVVDFGSGLGPTGLATLGHFPKTKIQVIERSSEALQLSKELGLDFDSVSTPKQKEVTRSQLLSFSYSLTELATLPAWVLGFEHLMIVEPSTRDDGRRLLEFRKKLIQEGYSMWAPCPHQSDCPLLVNHPHDWCHDRIHFAQPDWWQKMEKRLPFQNPTLTFSYLLASRRPRPQTEKQIRLVGDLMKEKGKSRQMICRGPNREFFSWLKRQGDAPEMPRGALLVEPAGMVQAGSELRPGQDLEVLPLAPNPKT